MAYEELDAFNEGMYFVDLDKNLIGGKCKAKNIKKHFKGLKDVLDKDIGNGC